MVRDGVNYQKEMDKLLEAFSREGRRPTLLLHSCCGPCSSYVLEYLCAQCNITVLYDNPNIFPEAEYVRRKGEQIRLIDAFRRLGREIGYIESDYDYGAFLRVAGGVENEKEGGERCRRCYALRLRETARRAAQGGYDYFATTLTVSPYKNAPAINALGLAIARETPGARYLPSDFKKRGGYQRSIELSAEYGLYRQHYCGCGFSLRDAQKACDSCDAQAGGADGY